MKKKVFGCLGIATIIAVMVFNANIGLRVDYPSDIALATIEALANGEDPSDNCYTEIGGGYGFDYECGTLRLAYYYVSYDCRGTGYGSCVQGEEIFEYNCDGTLLRYSKCIWPSTCVVK